MRDYDPTTGRYLQADPLGLVDGASVYGYARQNPGRWTDPTGKYSVCYTDAKTGKMKCVDTYCPSGDCGSLNPDYNDRELGQCMDTCSPEPSEIEGADVCAFIATVATVCLHPAVGLGVEIACIITAEEKTCLKMCRK
jgi:hypothetical protein